MIGHTLSWLVAAALLAIGVGAIVAPRMSSAQYGLPLDDARALQWVRALGVRDIAIGLVVLALLVMGEARALCWTIGLSAVVAVGDLTIVGLGARPLPWRSVALHGAGAVGMLVTAALVHLTI